MAKIIDFPDSALVRREAAGGGSLADALFPDAPLVPIAAPEDDRVRRALDALSLDEAFMVLETFGRRRAPGIEEHTPYALCGASGEESTAKDERLAAILRKLRKAGTAGADQPEEPRHAEIIEVDFRRASFRSRN